MIVAEASYEVSDPTINSQVLKIKDAGADLFYSRLDAEAGGAGDQEDRTSSTGSRCTSSTSTRARSAPC